MNKKPPLANKSGPLTNKSGKRTSVSKIWEVPIYCGCDLLINISDDAATEFNHYKHVFGDFYVATAKAFHVYKDGNFGLFFSRRTFGCEEIAHESFHATARIMEWIGNNLTSGSHEPYAYLIGWIAARVDQLAKENDVKIVRYRAGPAKFESLGNQKFKDL